MVRSVTLTPTPIVPQKRSVVEPSIRFGADPAPTTPPPNGGRTAGFDQLLGAFIRRAVLPVLLTVAGCIAGQNGVGPEFTKFNTNKPGVEKKDEQKKPEIRDGEPVIDEKKGVDEKAGTPKKGKRVGQPDQPPTPSK